VRKRQKRKLIETDKRKLIFEVRNQPVELQKIERWMKRHNIAESFIYAPSPAACKLALGQLDLSSLTYRSYAVCYRMPYDLRARLTRDGLCILTSGFGLVA